MRKIIHGEYVLVGCDDPTSLRMEFEGGKPTKYYVDEQLVDLLPFHDWACMGKVKDTDRQDWIAITGHEYLEATAMKDLLNSHNLDPQKTLIFKQKP